MCFSLCALNLVNTATCLSFPSLLITVSIIVSIPTAISLIQAFVVSTNISALPPSPVGPPPVFPSHATRVIFLIRPCPAETASLSLACPSQPALPGSYSWTVKTDQASPLETCPAVLTGVKVPPVYSHSRSSFAPPDHFSVTLSWKSTSG